MCYKFCPAVTGLVSDGICCYDGIVNLRAGGKSRGKRKKFQRLCLGIVFAKIEETNKVETEEHRAGAQLVSQYGIFATSAEYRALFDEAKELAAPVPSKVALNCGIYEIYRREDSRVSENYLPEGMSEKIEESVLHILNYVNKNFPETFLMASINDKLLPASGLIKEKLEEFSVPYEYHDYGQSNPADGHVFHVNLRSEEGKRCNKEELEFFTRSE